MEESLEDLGYKLEVDSEQYMIYSNLVNLIAFDKHTRTVSSTVAPDRRIVPDFTTHDIEMKVLKAIYRKCKELGWIEE